MRDRAQYVIAECRHLATMTEEPGRTTRRFLSPPVRDVHEHLRRRMGDLGMEVHVDAIGNLRGLDSARRPEAPPYWALHRHCPDSALDGVLGGSWLSGFASPAKPRCACPSN
jgi:hypothetical protein